MLCFILLQSSEKDMRICGPSSNFLCVFGLIGVYIYTLIKEEVNGMMIIRELTVVYYTRYNYHYPSVRVCDIIFNQSILTLFFLHTIYLLSYQSLIGIRNKKIIFVYTNIYKQVLQHTIYNITLSHDGHTTN